MTYRPLNYRHLLVPALAPALLFVAACSGDDAPTGQVVAVVDGQEVTIAEVNAELNGASAPTPAAQKQLQQAALQNIVNRILLAKAADERDVADGPTASIVQARAEQMAKIELLERQMRSNVPTVAAEEIETFVTENPSMFAQRKIFLVEQFIVSNPPAGLREALIPLDTMEEVEAALTRFNVPPRRSFGVLDALTLQPEAVRQVAALTPNTVFILPDGNGLRINRVRETQVQPVTGRDATNVATEMLRGQRANQLVASSVQDILRQGQANVRYSDEFRPRAPAARPAARPGARPAAQPKAAAPSTE